MILFSIENLTIEEIAAMRQALNVIDIKGSSAQFIASLQNTFGAVTDSVASASDPLTRCIMMTITFIRMIIFLPY